MISAPLFVAALAELSHVFVAGSTNRAATHGAALLNVSQRDDDGGYHYMPVEKNLICICAKCGSTSLYELLYNLTFGRPWNYTDQPYIHDVASPRWEGKFKVLNSVTASHLITGPETFSFALMRDPKERLISSWKSKVACDGGGNWGTDLVDRAWMVPELRELAGFRSMTCMSFEKFVNTLAQVHHTGLAALLNVHFRPQQLGCFRDVAPPLWSMVAEITDGKAAAKFGKRFGDENVFEFPHDHSSPPTSSVIITPRAHELLNEITKEEYALLATRLA